MKNIKFDSNEIALIEELLTFAKENWVAFVENCNTRGLGKTIDELDELFEKLQSNIQK